MGIQAFQPRLIEGKAIRLHPLVCTAFNADFDGDQMAVHLPLGPEAILEAQMLMLASHNILNPANGAPITVPSQDMVLGLYYITKLRKSTPEYPVIGEGSVFYSPEEVIGDVLKATSIPRTAEFLDDIKSMGYKFAFQGGLSFSLGDIIIPKEKQNMISDANEQVQGIIGNYNMGLITNNERYNQVIDVWTSTNARLTDLAMKRISNAVIEKVEALIARVGGTVEKVDRWGKRRLAYAVKKFTDGFYVLINFEAAPAEIKEIDRVLKINDEVLRHLIVKHEA